MTAMLKKHAFSFINQEIETHIAWLGEIQGLKAEKMLRGQQPYTYVIRAGEQETENDTETNYYISFVLSDFTIRHQPIVITLTSEGWCYENYWQGGPYVDAKIDDVLHLIMHCEQGEPAPLALVK